MEKLLEVRDLKVWFPVKKGIFARTVGQVKAVDGVSFDLCRGETLGIVGESGCGKTTTVRAIAGLVRPTGGSFSLHGRLGMVFQDPLGSLNPRMTVRMTLGEIVESSNRRIVDVIGDPREVAAIGSSPTHLLDYAMVRLLGLVGLEPSALDRYPHEFSGGQRQRVCIARALSARPDLLVCDEAVSALDLSIRAQVLDLLLELKRTLDLGLLFITHDIGVVRHVADRVLVMHGGRIVESGPCEEVLSAPREDYTRYLIASVPRIGHPLA